MHGIEIQGRRRRYAGAEGLEPPTFSLQAQSRRMSANVHGPKAQFRRGVRTSTYGPGRLRMCDESAMADGTSRRPPPTKSSASGYGRVLDTKDKVLDYPAELDEHRRGTKAMLTDRTGI